MTCARAAPTNAIAPTIIAALTPIRFESLAWGTGDPPPKFSDIRPFCPADRTDRDQPLDVGRTIAEIGEHFRCVGADARGSRRARLWVAIEREPAWRKTLRGPTILLPFFELHGDGRLFTVTIGQLFAGLHG